MFKDIGHLLQSTTARSARSESMSERKDKKTTDKGRVAKCPHLTLVVPDEQAVFDDDLMPWDDEGLSAGSQGSEVDGSGLQSERAKYGLTVKQEAFCVAMLRGSASASAAYREAYDTSNMKPSSVHRRAHDVLTNVKVQARLDAGYLVKERDELHSHASRRDFVLERLTVEATDAVSDSARVAALGLLGKHEAMFTDKVQHEEPDMRSAAEIREALEAKLKGLLADGA